MKIQFNNNLEALYAVDYCVNRGQNIIQQSGVANNQAFLDELYRIFLEKVSDTARDDAVSLGDYHRKAEYALNPENPLPDLTPIMEYFEQQKPLQDKIIADIEANNTLSDLHLDGLRDFLGIDQAIEINVIPSQFINHGFGVFNGSSNFVIGAKADESGTYSLVDLAPEEVYHDYAYPYVHMYLYENGLGMTSGANNAEYLDELITRVLTIIFSSRIKGDGYIESALSSQDRMHLGQARIYLSEYLENQSKIFNLKDFIDILIKDGLISKIA